ncbi:MAG: hypothetical protein ACR2RE_25060 [Geminicoccaceae bacterium]
MADRISEFLKANTQRTADMQTAMTDAILARKSFGSALNAIRAQRKADSLAEAEFELKREKHALEQQKTMLDALKEGRRQGEKNSEAVLEATEAFIGKGNAKDMSTLVEFLGRDDQPETDATNAAGNVARAYSHLVKTGQIKPAKEKFEDAEWKQLRAEMTALGYDDDQIAKAKVNRDRYQFSVDSFGQKIIYDRYNARVVDPTGVPAGPTVTEAGPETDPLLARPTPPGGFQQATGQSGFWGQIGNAITDAFGFGLAAPDMDAAAVFMDQLQSQTLVDLAAEVTGRPSNLVIENLRKLTITPRSILEGDTHSLQKLGQMRAEIGREMSRIQGMLDDPGGIKPAELSKARANQLRLRELWKSYDHVIKNWQIGASEMIRLETEEQYRAFLDDDRYPVGTPFVDPTGQVRQKP